MASAEARAGYAVKHCFRQDFRMPPNSSGHQSSVSNKLEPDLTPSDSINYTDSDTSLDMKWWLHVKTNLGGDANYTCQQTQHLNSWESDLEAFSCDSVKIGGDQSVKNIDAISCVGSANTIAVEQSWNVSPKCMKKTNDTRMPKIEAAFNNDLCLAPKKKNQGEFWFSNGEYVESDITSFLISEQCKSTSSDLEPHWIGAEKRRPWWHATRKDDLASLVAQKSHEHIENCDLPESQIKPFRKIPTLQPAGIDQDKNPLSSSNQKSEMCSSVVNGCTSGTLTSGFSFEDSNRTFSSSQSRDSTCDSSDKDDHDMNSKSKDKAELLKALCHSQTRAREAEMAAQQAYNEKEHILSLFFKQASQLFAYKQWLHVMQLENLCLQLRNKNQPLLNLFPYRRKSRRKIRSGCSRRRGIRKCAVAFAVGLALAGAGLLLGWTLGCMFPSF